jgi:hypothetical protein
LIALGQLITATAKGKVRLDAIEAELQAAIVDSPPQTSANTTAAAFSPRGPR